MTILIMIRRERPGKNAAFPDVREGWSGAERDVNAGRESCGTSLIFLELALGPSWHQALITGLASSDLCYLRVASKVGETFQGAVPQQVLYLIKCSLKGVGRLWPLS
jgi:hypothetical protein